jgi:hypothetical protein
MTGMITKSAALVPYLGKPSPNANVGTLIQVARFVKNLEPDHYQEEVIKNKRDPEKESHAELYRRLDKNNAEYKNKKIDLDIYQTVTHFGHGLLGESIHEGLMTYPWTAPLMGAFSAIENHKIKEIQNLEGQVIADNLEFLKRIDLTYNDHQNLKKMGLKQATEELGKIVGAKFWEHYTTNDGDLLPDVVKAEYLRIHANVLKNYKELPEKSASSDQTKEQFTQNIVKQKFTNTVHNTIKVRNEILQFPEQWQEDIQGMKQASQETKKELEKMQEDLKTLKQGSIEALKASRFLLDIQYRHLSLEEKMNGIERGLYPKKLGEYDTLVHLRKWEKRETAFFKYTEYSKTALTIASHIGIKIPKNLNKGIVAAENAFMLVKGISTGDISSVFRAVGGFVGLFKGAQPDISTIRYQDIMNALSMVYDGQQEILAQLEKVQKQLIEIYTLNYEMAQAVDAIGRTIIKQHSEVMASLNKIDSDVLYNSELLIEIHLDHFKELKDLRKARSSSSYQCYQGVFASHETASRFFKDYFTDFKKAMTRNYKLFDTDYISPVLKFASAYKSQFDVNSQSSNNRTFHDMIWGSSHQFYGYLSYADQSKVFSALFEPPIYVGSIDHFKQSSWRQENKFSSIFTQCKQFFNDLIAPAIVLKGGEYAIDFHRYYTLIKEFNQGTLFSIDELLDPNLEKMGHTQTKGLRMLERIFTYVNLSIAQHHLISGGPLIPLFYSSFMENLASYYQKIRSKEVSEKEKETLRNEVRQSVELIAKNQLFAKNLILYTLRKKLDFQEENSQNKVQCVQYRLAYNYVKDQHALQDLFPGWEFVPLESSKFSDGPGWALRLPFHELDKDGEVLIELTHPSDLFFGRLDYPIDLLELINLRESLIQEITGYGFIKELSEPLQEVLGNDILLYV